MKPKFGVLLPQGGFSALPENISVFAERAEGLGFSSLWVGDHFALPREQTSEYPYPQAHGSGKSYQVPSASPFLEASTLLSFVAATTTRIGLGISVAILPYRHPVHWVKILGTLQRLSRNRLTLGAGAGWLAEEFELLGLDFAARGAMADEILEIIDEAWRSDDEVSFSGSHYQVRGFSMVPPTDAETRPDFWIGGNGKRALERTKRHGATWHPYMGGMSPEAVERGVAWLANASDATPTVALYMPITFADSVGPQRPWESGSVIGDAHEVASTVAAYREVGVNSFVLNFGGNAEQRLGRLEQLADALL